MLNSSSGFSQPYGVTSAGRLSENINPLDPAATQQLMGPTGEAPRNNGQAPQLLQKPMLDREGVINPEAALAMGDQALYGTLAYARSNQKEEEAKGAWSRGTMGAVGGAALGALVAAVITGGWTLIPALLISAGVGATMGGTMGANEGAYIARNAYVARDLAVDGSLNGIYLKG